MADDAAIRPEFKKAMDSYEAFFGEFVEFMQLLSDDPSNLTLMAKVCRLHEPIHRDHGGTGNHR